MTYSGSQNESLQVIVFCAEISLLQRFNRKRCEFNMSWRYLVYGLCLQAEMALPELIPLDKTDERLPDATIRWGQVDIPTLWQEREAVCRLEPDVGTLYYQHTGRFRLQKGREIIVEPAAGVTEELVRPYLLGPVLTALLHQRGALVLHASSVALSFHNSKRAVAFLGQSQSGKSTMASALYQFGHTALSDDVVAVALDSAIPSGSQPLVFRGLPHLKLRPPTVAALGQSMEMLHQWHPSHDGYLLRLPVEIDDLMQPVPLCGLYVLHDASELKIEAMVPEDALVALANNSVYVRLLEAPGRAKNFLQCAQLVKRVPVFRLERPRNLALLNDVARLVEEHQQAQERSQD